MISRLWAKEKCGFVRRKFWFSAVLMMAAMMLSLAAVAEGCPLIGEWAFAYKPEETVLSVREDGQAVYQQKNWQWTDDGTFLHLADGNGGELLLRYVVSEKLTAIYPRTVYHRGAQVEDQGGLIGVWKADESEGTSFVFTPSGFFMEDSSFGGTFTADNPAGTFLLHYGEVFSDTLCYYSIQDDARLEVEYPWPIVRK